MKGLVVNSPSAFASGRSTPAAAPAFRTAFAALAEAYLDGVDWEPRAALERQGITFVVDTCIVVTPVLLGLFALKLIGVQFFPLIGLAVKILMIGA